MPFKHGITITELNDGSQSLTTASTSIIGLVATSSDADADMFPLDKAALITDVEYAIGYAGTSGTLAKSLRAIADQTSPVIVVVRVGMGEGDDEAAKAASQSSKVIGTDENGKKTGLQALLSAEAQLGVRPRVLGAPGLDTQEVTTALTVIAKKLYGFVYAAAIGNTVSECIAYRKNFDARELMLIYPDWLAYDTDASATVTSYAVARALGVRAKIDTETGPHKTISNVAVSGVTGVSKDVHWDLQSDTTDAALLNAAQVTACVRTTVGYKFWGNRTCDGTGDYPFESTVRVAQAIRDTIAAGMEWAMDKPLTPGLVRDIVEKINGYMRDMKAAGYILGGSCWYSESRNSKATLGAGKLRIDYDFTVPPPLEDLGFYQHITDTYLADFSKQVSAS